eukprot:m.164205 g.164205  ORF g.164205 m.164205 type:complete len:90 (-) comp31325_c1_seq4:1341-1610(-)
MYVVCVCVFVVWCICVYVCVCVRARTLQQQQRKGAVYVWVTLLHAFMVCSTCIRSYTQHMSHHRTTNMDDLEQHVLGVQPSLVVCSFGT